MGLKMQGGGMGKGELPILAVTSEWIIRPLPHQTYLMDELRKNIDRQNKFKEIIRTRYTNMDLTQAASLCKEGSKVRRPSWDEDMFMWYTHAGFLAHTHPYPELNQEKIVDLSPYKAREGYIYVCEKDDAIAADWEIIATKNGIRA